MNTKLKNEISKVFQFKNDEDKAEHDAKILMFKFLSIVEQEMEIRDMTKKDLAHKLNTSPSYITQLFRGTKTINLLKLAQLQNLFEIEFEIKLASKKNGKKKPIRMISKSQRRKLVTAR